jgi:hypothetical protein
MVTDRSRQGGGTFGCLLSLVVLIAIVYMGSTLGRPYFRFQRYNAEVKSMARFAGSLSDSTIRLRLRAQVDSLGLPPAARQITIKRSVEPDRVLITVEYDEVVQLLFVGEKVLHFTPRGENGP